MLLLGLEEVTVLQIISVEPSPTRVCRLYQALLEVLGTEPCQERQAPIHEGPGRKVTVTGSDALGVQAGAQGRGRVPSASGDRLLRGCSSPALPRPLPVSWGSSFSAEAVLA